MLQKVQNSTFYSDPEAVAKVFRDFHGKIIVVPLELCEDYSFSWVSPVSHYKRRSKRTK